MSEYGDIEHVGYNTYGPGSALKDREYTYSTKSPAAQRIESARRDYAYRRFVGERIYSFGRLFFTITLVALCTGFLVYLNNHQFSFGDFMVGFMEMVSPPFDYASTVDTLNQWYSTWPSWLSPLSLLLQPVTTGTVGVAYVIAYLFDVYAYIMYFTLS